MSGARGTLPRPTRARIGVATLLAVLAGAGIGMALAREPGTQRADPGGPRVGLRSGAVRLPLPAGWVPLDRHSSLPGLHDATAVLGAYTMVALDLRPPEDASLLPAALRAASGGTLPEPRLDHLGGRPIWRYEIAGTRERTGVVAMALPTTGGVVTIACQIDAGSAATARYDCGEAMNALRLEGASELAPAPEAAGRIALPGIVAMLNGERRSGRRALRAATSPGGRGDAARRIAMAYRSAVERLRPVAAGEARRLVAAFAGLARRHLRLAAHSRRRDPIAAERAGAAIEHGERRLQRLLVAFSSRPQAGSAVPRGPGGARARLSRAPGARAPAPARPARSPGS